MPEYINHVGSTERRPHFKKTDSFAVVKDTCELQITMTAHQLEKKDVGRGSVVDRRKKEKGVIHKVKGFQKHIAINFSFEMIHGTKPCS